MTDRKFVFVLWSLVLSSVLGCGDGTADVSATSDVTTAPSVNSMPVAPALPAPPAPKLPSISVPSGVATDKAELEVEEPMEREKAQAGVGKKGRGYGGGVISEPVRAYFRTGQNIVFQIQIPSAVRMFEAENDGKGLASNEEFMEKIIKANSIQLPELPDGDSYFYDVEKKELLVQRPAE